MAVEDAAALSKALSYAMNKHDLKPSLRLVEQIRISRTRQVQKASLANGQVLHICDGPQQQARDAELRPSVEGKPLYRSPYGINDRATQAWCYGYDVERDIEEAWVSADGDW
jgi:salicylate hydroxylase